MGLFSNTGGGASTAKVEKLLEKIDENTDEVEVKIGDVSLDSSKLDVELSTRSSEATVAEIKTNTENIGTPLQDTKIVNPLPQEAGTFEPKICINKDNVGLGKEETLTLIKTKTDNLDITLTVLKNALRGVDNKDLTTLHNVLSSIKSKTDNLDILLSVLRDALKGTGEKDFTSLQAVIQLIQNSNDVNLSTLATEITAGLIKSVLDNIYIETEVPLQIDVVGTTTYIGYANVGSATSGPVWRIKKIVETGDDVVITFADGNKSKDNIWDNRLTLTYA